MNARETSSRRAISAVDVFTTARFGRRPVNRGVTKTVRCTVRPARGVPIRQPGSVRFVENEERLGVAASSAVTLKSTLLLPEASPVSGDDEQGGDRADRGDCRLDPTACSSTAAATR